MLISFRVSNFLSFNGEVEFSMVAGQPRQLPTHVIHTGEGRSRIDILKSAVVYGANASGKSNLIKAMDFARNVIVNGVKSQQTYNKHFRLDPANIDKPSKFEFEFKIDDKIYAYGFSLHIESQKFKSEWLTELRKTTNNIIFEREVLNDGKSNFVLHLKLDKKGKTRFEVYIEDILDSQLFLSELNSKNLSTITEASLFLKTLFWFRQILVIIYPESTFTNIAFIPKDNKLKDKYCQALSYFNTGISDLVTEELNYDDMYELFSKEYISKNIEKLKDGGSTKLSKKIGPDKLNISVRKSLDGEVSFAKLSTKHTIKNGNQIDFSIEEESDGTKRILDFIPMLVSQIKRTYIIDEIDRSLHPELTRKLIEIFQENTEGVESQLIVTTHESSLLDLNLLRRDEIWFAEKNEHGESHLYSLEEFKPRHDVELRKAYLLGRFGAIPFISDAKTLGWGKKNLQNDSKTTLHA
jgi:uncharacterized protein